MTTPTRWQLTPLAELDVLWWQDWDALNKEHFASHPGLSSTFVRLTAKHFSSRQMLGATLRSGNSTLIKTLIVESARAQWRVFCPAQAVIAPLVFDQKLGNQSRPLIRLLASLPGIALKLDLLNQDPRYSILAGRNAPRSRISASWDSVSIHEPRGFAAYWASRRKDLRDNLRRRMHRADQDQLHFTLDVHSEPTTVAAAVDRFGMLESRGWKGHEGSSLHPDNVQGRFYRELMQSMATSGNAKIFELRAGERLAASLLVLSGGSMSIFLKTTHDEALRQYSIGYVLMHHILRHVMDMNSDTVVEFYTHASREQLLWATSTAPMHNVCVYRSHGLKLLTVAHARLRKRRPGK